MRSRRPTAPLLIIFITCATLMLLNMNDTNKGGIILGSVNWFDALITAGGIVSFFGILISQIVFYKKDTHRFDTLDHSDEKIESRIESGYNRIYSEHNAMISEISKINPKIDALETGRQEIHDYFVAENSKKEMLDGNKQQLQTSIDNLQIFMKILTDTNAENQKLKSVLEEKEKYISSLQHQKEKLETKLKKYEKKYDKELEL